jgi:osmotically-inducible protein OsmY
MKTIIATLLATAAGASFAAAPTANLNHDAQTYKSVTQKAADEYKVAVAKCDAMSGNGKDVCMREASAQRAHAQADAIAQYKNTKAERSKANVAAAEADYGLAKAKCADMTGADKDKCLAEARSWHTTAVADAKAGRTTAAGATSAGMSTGGTTVVAEDQRSAQVAIDKCKDAAGNPKTACLIDNGSSPTATAARQKAANATENVKDNAAAVAQRTENATENAADRTRAATADAARKTENVAANATENTREATANAAANTREAAHDVAQGTKNVAAKAANNTREAAHTVAEKSREVAHDVAQNTREATATAAAKTDRVAARTGDVVEDSAITTKVKAGIFAEPNLKSLGIHVETEKGVVMLSGFVNSKTEAQRAVEVAKDVKGVSSVKSALKVK